MKLLGNDCIVKSAIRIVITNSKQILRILSKCQFGPQCLVSNAYRSATFFYVLKTLNSLLSFGSDTH